MTEKPSDILRARLAENAAELQRAQADAELYERLTKARAETARLQKAGAELTASLSKALEAEAKADRKAAEARFRNLSITTTYPSADRPSGVLNARFTIRWESPKWNYRTGENELTAHQSDGFPALAGDAYAYIMEHRTDLIPAVIMELAPGDPEAAMSRYFTARRRGYA